MGEDRREDAAKESVLLATAQEMFDGRGKRALNAYYFAFDSTGNEHVDLILGAVAAAGKAYHSTEMWNQDDYDHGWSYIDLIQAAANEAARHIGRDVTHA